MTLAREVPAMIGKELLPFLQKLLSDSGHEYKKPPGLEDFLFAVHPGGPKIIDSVQEILGLREDQVAASKEVLFERGNMSSATLPHVWKKINESNPESGKLVISLAFGPGLTIFGSVFEVI